MRPPDKVRVSASGQWAKPCAPSRSICTDVPCMEDASAGISLSKCTAEAAHRDLEISAGIDGPTRVLRCWPFSGRSTLNSYVASAESLMMTNVSAIVAEEIKIEQASDADAWDRFVDEQPQSTAYHRWGWKQVVESAFGWPTHFLAAKANTRIVGILPLVHQKSRIFGSFITSMPFINGGGILATDEVVQRTLLREAIQLAQTEGATSLELRHRSEHQLGLRTKKHKVTVVKRVQQDTERTFAELDKKLRADVRKPMKLGLTSEHGGAELLDTFYPIFARNMRDLGTPVYGREFFAEILRAFPDTTYITVVRHRGVAVASSLLTAYRDTIEAGWSSSLREYLPLKPNMLLYWQNLCLAAEKGYTFFDFGRSSIGSGTHRFKLQWGCEEKPLYWDYWVADDRDLPELNPKNRKFQLAIHIWQRLPLAVANRLGPSIVRCLP